jgi:gamma-glutamylcyclotransferase (GGCT)/AIG2-like uncharacterized protein YtfP
MHDRIPHSPDCGSGGRGFESFQPPQESPTEPQLFVYGTLRSSFQNKHAQLLRQQAEFLGPATVPGRLYAIRDYPGLIVSSNPGEQVAGEVYRLYEPGPTLAALDAYEADEYERLLVDGRLDSGEAILAWVYVYRRPVDEARRIQSGDFLLP